jgi:hypothetical protein
VHSEAQSQDVHKRRRQIKVEAFGRLGILPSIGRKCASLGEHSSRRIGGEKRSRPLNVSRPGKESQEEHTGRMDHRPSDLDPETQHIHWICREFDKV